MMMMIKKGAADRATASHRQPIRARDPGGDCLVWLSVCHVLFKPLPHSPSAVLNYSSLALALLHSFPSDSLFTLSLFYSAYAFGWSGKLLSLGFFLHPSNNVWRPRMEARGRARPQSQSFVTSSPQSQANKRLKSLTSLILETLPIMAAGCAQSMPIFTR